MLRQKAALLAFCGIFCLTISALAHHGWSSYDETKTVAFTGVIRESGYDNPHSFVDVAVADPKGAPPKVWHAVLAPPRRMTSQGLTKEMIAPGTTVTIIGYPSVTAPNEVRVEELTIAGKTTNLR